MSNPHIQRIHGREILDSRGNPTVEVEVELSDGATGSAQVPSGASTGQHEALELRDQDAERYHGKGVRKAVGHINKLMAKELPGWPAYDQLALDARLCELDGTADKSRLGANALLGVSCAVARAAANSRKVPLWRYLAGDRKPLVPLPMVNILSGGHHARHNFEFQDFLVIPHGFDLYSEALHACVRIHAAAREVLERGGCLLTGHADEGGWGPALATNRQALDVLMEAIRSAGYEPGREVSIGIDVAASHFHEKGQYELRSERRSLGPGGMVELIETFCREFPVISVEDALEENDWSGWHLLTERLRDRVQLLGDDLFTTNPARLRRGIEARVANAVLVKMNQIGTLTETFQVIDLAREAGYLAVISARSGETEDTFLADLAVASGAGQIKIGSVARERMSKYNRLLALEEFRGLEYAGASAFERFRKATRSG